MTRVVMLPSDQTACGFYRMMAPASAVRSVRPDWNVEVYDPTKVQLGVGPDGMLWQLQGFDPNDVDLFIMQRVATRAQAELLRFMQDKGTATIMDSDDAMWCIDPDNSAWKAWNHGAPAQWHWLDVASSTVDLTTCTTAALERRYGEHGRAEVLPNCVPADVAEIESTRAALDPTPTIGWSGFTATHPGDLKVVEDAVAAAQQDSGCIVRVIGDAEGASRDWGCPVEKVNPTPIGVPYFTALTTLDIGLAPLRDTPFNRGKSYLKALEYASLGLVVVASPTPANRELQKTVPILLARTRDEWYDAIMTLVHDADMRQELGAVGREQVQKLHTYEANAERWARAWERAMKRRRAMSN